MKPVAAQHSAYIVFGFAGVALLVTMTFGIILLRRRQSARGQGFIEVKVKCRGLVRISHRLAFHCFQVDACTPEEKHVAGMQVNGYENPTYRFFESA